MTEENEVQEMIAWAFTCVAGLSVFAQKAANAQNKDGLLEVGKTIYMFGAEAALIAARMMMPDLSEHEFLTETWASVCDRESLLSIEAHVKQAQEKAGQP